MKQKTETKKTWVGDFVTNSQIRTFDELAKKQVEIRKDFPEISFEMYQERDSIYVTVYVDGNGKYYRPDPSENYADFTNDGEKCRVHYNYEVMGEGYSLFIEQRRIGGKTYSYNLM